MFLFRENRLRFGNALIIFNSLVAVKFLLLVFWTGLHTEVFSFEYLQFPDEYRYAIRFQPGDPIANIYDLLTYYLRTFGFNILNLKVFNILITSFAIVRLYSLIGYAKYKNKYILFLLTIGGVLFLHVNFYSIFVLKDPLFFYVTIEFLIQLLQRRKKYSLIKIGIIWLGLIAVRKQMVLTGVIFLFDDSWRLRKKRLLLSIPIVFLLLDAYGYRFYRYVSRGFKYSLGMEGGLREIMELVFTGIPNYWELYIKLVVTNIKRGLSVFYQVDIVNAVIVLLEWVCVGYLLFFHKAYRNLVAFWPILAVATLYFILGVMTIYNIRYNIFPATILIFVLILSSCKIVVEK